METQERYATTECPENGHSAPPDAANPAEWWELAAVTVQLSFVKKRATERGTINVRRQAFNPTELFAEPEAKDLPYGTALEKLIEAGRQQAEQQE